MAVWSKALLCLHSLAGNAGSNSSGDMDVCLFLSVCRQVQVSETGRSLVQRSLSRRLCVALSVIWLNNNRPSLTLKKKNNPSEEDCANIDEIAAKKKYSSCRLTFWRRIFFFKF